MRGANAGRAIRAALASRRLRLAARLLTGLGVLAAVVAQVGTGPFLLGLRSVDLPAAGAALLLAGAATGTAAWRWRVIATRLGLRLTWPTAVAMYYRSQFLNTVLPGGVLGDVHRALAQGRIAGGVPQAARAVVIERTIGQVVQIALALVVVGCFAPELAPYLLAAVGIGLALVLLLVTAPAAASVRARRRLRRELDALAAGVGSPAALAQVVVASIVVVGCHAATFGVAVAAVGASVPPPRLAGLALLVLLAASVPVNLGGWGPREGIAGWAFGVAGLGVTAGVAASTVFGILAVVSVAPGLVVVATAAIRSGAGAARARAAVVRSASTARPTRAFAVADAQRRAGS